MHLLAPRVVLALFTVLGLAALLAAPAGATPPPPAPTPAPTTSTGPTPGLNTHHGAGRTAGCPHRLTPPPPVDKSEAPPPGSPTPTPVPVPAEPVGGPRMGECGLVLPVGAPPLPDGITAAAWLLADAGSTEVLAARDPHGRHRPASTIKLLTALLAVDTLPLDQVVIGTEGDARQEGSRAGIGLGGRYTVRDLLAGLLLRSGNDTAHALARQMGGMTQTVRQMNELAARLGALDTRAATPSGLDGPGMSTSAYDLALLLGHALARPPLADLLSTRQVSFPGHGEHPEFMLSNDNKLLVNYPGAVGGKTGFTDDSRHTYVGAAVRDGRLLIVVLLRGEQHPVPMWEQAAQLLDYGFDLPTGRPVGHLVNAAQSDQAMVQGGGHAGIGQPGQPGGAGGPPGTRGASGADRPGGATAGLPDGGDDQRKFVTLGSGDLLAGALWAGVVVALLAVLAVVVRLRRP